MDYGKIYSDIMERSKTRRLNGYKERHHIVPRSLEGSNTADNIAVLTAREHYIVHKLLSKLFCSVRAYTFAFVLMQNRSKSRNSRQYENFALKKYNSSLSRTRNKEFRRTVSDRFKGKPLSDNHKSNISGSNQGKTMPYEQRRKISDAHQIPWENKTAIKNGTTKYWKLAGIFYNWWVANGKDMKRNPGGRMVRNLGYNCEQTGRSCITRFQSGWNPYEDQNWLKFKDSGNE